LEAHIAAHNLQSPDFVSVKDEEQRFHVNNEHDDEHIFPEELEM
jgi:hypothetical protein